MPGLGWSTVGSAQMAAINMMANILRRQLLERGLDPPSEKDCEAIVSAMFDGATKLGRLTKGPEYREGRVDQPKAKK
jgi:hypothetical protein